MCLVQFFGTPLGQSIAAFLAALIGFFLGFLSNWLILRNDRKRRRKAVFQAVVKCLEHNKEIAESITKNMKANPKYPVTYPMDSEALDATSSLRSEVMGKNDIDGNIRLNEIMWRLKNLNEKFDILLRTGYSDEFYTVLRKTILDGQNGQLPELQKMLEKAIAWINGELEKEK